MDCVTQCPLWAGQSEGLSRLERFMCKCMQVCKHPYFYCLEVCKIYCTKVWQNIFVFTVRWQEILLLYRQTHFVDIEKCLCYMRKNELQTLWITTLWSGFRGITTFIIWIWPHADFMRVKIPPLDPSWLSGLVCPLLTERQNDILALAMSVDRLRLTYNLSAVQPMRYHGPEAAVSPKRLGERRLCNSLGNGSRLPANWFLCLWHTQTVSDSALSVPLSLLSPFFIRVSANYRCWRFDTPSGPKHDLICALLNVCMWPDK